MFYFYQENSLLPEPGRYGSDALLALGLDFFFFSRLLDHPIELNPVYNEV